MSNRPGRGNCSACGHPDREQIDIDLAAGGESQRSIAKRYGMTEGALRAHRRNHRNPALAALTAARKSTIVRAGDDMGAELRGLLDRCEVFLVAAELSGNASDAMAAIRELRQIWELWGRATGALKERPPIVLNLVQSQEWQELSAELFVVLQRHPEALSDVRTALRLDPPRD